MALAEQKVDVERRKMVRVRLRPDLVIDAHRYEGRTYFIIKDPVSLRYYRLKEHEHFLLGFMDGHKTLNDAQKAYEKHYRPDRLRLEDLEAFAQQLVRAGLAQNESPAAGQLLYDRRAKRKRTELIQKFTNLLYIKVPVFDPDKLLRWMLQYISFFFSGLFFLSSLILMASAIMLVTLHFDMFLAKMPSYYEFFSFKTIIYLWIALGVVKVIHEFGHGLSCRYYGGEVHEMGFLLLCFSPALYANVSDAWTLPNKWHRIIISAAGIYVELVIASIATYVWWYSPASPFIHNLSLSLMVVCSVSTVVFNGNPLMRYDGYYVLADWMEIPNLRERANKYLQNLFLDRCLGIEVQPEPYMDTGRKILFITYGVISYVYRWIVTFTILFFLYNFLKPYRLEVVSQILTLASAVSMVGWPIYNLGKNIYRRGRVPDMKRWRVIATSLVFLALAAVALLVPLPVNRLRGVALVMPQPESLHRFYSTHPGVLEFLPIQTGQPVARDEVLATLFNREVESKLATARAEVEAGEQSLRALLEQSSRANRESDKRRISESILQASRSLEKSRQVVDDSERLKRDFLKFVSPIDGLIGTAPRKEDIGRQVEASSRDPFITVYPSNRLAVCLPLTTSEYNQLVRDCKGTPSSIPNDNIIIRVHGREGSTWNGSNLRLLPSEARDIPLALTSRAGGPVAVKATNPGEPMVPQAQQFLVYIDFVAPDDAILPGNLAQVKIYLKPETCGMWLWRTVNDVFELGLFL